MKKHSLLNGLKILDLSRVLAGPYATQTLGDLGATVYKIERPNYGDDTRKWSPPTSKQANLSAYFMSCNRNKKSVTIDITKSQGQEIITEMSKKCDVFIENYQVDKLKEYNLDYESIKKVKKDIIYASLTGYGQNGTKSSLPGYDFIVQGESGVMSITGEEKPYKIGVAVSDVMTGMYAVTGILSSIIYRNQTGIGQHIDLSLFDCSLSYLANQGMNYLATDQAPKAKGNVHPNICPYESFNTKDYPIIITVGNDKQYEEFCKIVGLEYNEKYKTNSNRVLYRNELAQKIQEKLIEHNRDYWLEKLHQGNIPCGSINNIKQAFQEPQVSERKMIWNVKYNDQEAPTIGNPLRFSETKIEENEHIPPPHLGQDTLQVLENDFGFSNDQIQEWKKQGII